jgi:hypothetical protein
MSPETVSPAEAARAAVRRAVSPRADALAERLERGVRALAELASALSDAQWSTPLPHDGRTVGVVVHHVASVYPVEIQLAQAVAGGMPITGVVPADIDAMNAQHAREHAHTTRAEAIGLLRQNAAVAAAAIRALSDAELDRAAPASLYGDAPLTAQFILEDHAVRHSYHHLARIRALLGV